MSARPIFALDDVRARIEAAVPELAGALKGAGAFADVVESGNVPENVPAGFVLPGGIRGGSCNAAVGAFIQDTEQVVSVVLAERYAGDATGDLALPVITPLVEKVILAVAGWVPSAECVGVFKLVQAELVGIKQGALLFQIDFALIDQLRIFA